MTQIFIGPFVSLSPHRKLRYDEKNDEIFLKTCSECSNHQKITFRKKYLHVYMCVRTL